MEVKENGVNISSDKGTVKVLTGDGLRILEDNKESKRLVKSILLKCVAGEAVTALIEEYVPDENGSFTHSTVDDNGKICTLTKKTLYFVTEDSKINLNVRRGAIRTDNSRTTQESIDGSGLDYVDIGNEREPNERNKVNWLD